MQVPPQVPPPSCEGEPRGSGWSWPRWISRRVRSDLQAARWMHHGERRPAHRSCGADPWHSDTRCRQSDASWCHIYIYLHHAFSLRFHPPPWNSSRLMRPVHIARACDAPSQPQSRRSGRCAPRVKHPVPNPEEQPVLPPRPRKADAQNRARVTECRTHPWGPSDTVKLAD